MTKNINKKGRYSVSLKEAVAWEAMIGEKSMAQIASQYGVSVDQVQEWREQGKEGIRAAFKNRSKRERELERELELTRRALCKREIELEWLTKKSKELGL